MKHSRGVEFQTETDDDVIEFAHSRGDEPSGEGTVKKFFPPTLTRCDTSFLLIYKHIVISTRHQREVRRMKY